MKKSISALLSFLLIMSVMLSGCEVIGGIFKAGMWTATIIIVLIIAIVIYIISKVSGRNKT
jgi:hypothetical protein